MWNIALDTSVTRRVFLGLSLLISFSIVFLDIFFKKKKKKKCGTLHLKHQSQDECFLVYLS